MLRAYRLVSAHLYRMRNRSSIAEDAWSMAASECAIDPEALEPSSVRRLNTARNRAVERIVDSHFAQLEKSRAIVAIDEAVRTAHEAALLELCLN